MDNAEKVEQRDQRYDAEKLKSVLHARFGKLSFSRTVGQQLQSSKATEYHDDTPAVDLHVYASKNQDQELEDTIVKETDHIQRVQSPNQSLTSSRITQLQQSKNFEAQRSIINYPAYHQKAEPAVKDVYANADR